MSYLRGDVLLVRYPFATGAGSKIRPALVVQNNRNNRRLTNLIVAAITSTTHRSGESTQLLIEIGSPAGASSGLLRDSVVSCENLATLDVGFVARKIVSLPDEAMQAVGDCLRASLEL